MSNVFTLTNSIGARLGLHKVHSHRVGGEPPSTSRSSGLLAVWVATIVGTWWKMWKWDLRTLSDFTSMAIRLAEVYVTSWLDIWSSQQRPQSLRGGYDLKLPGWESRWIDINQEGPGRISSNVIHCPLLMLGWNSFSILCAGFCQTNYCPVMGKFLVGVRPLAKRFQAGAPYRPGSICVWAKCSLTLWLQCNLENVPHLSRCSLNCQFSYQHTEHDMFKLTYLQNPPVPNSSTMWHSSMWHSSTRWLGESCREDGLRLLMLATQRSLPIIPSCNLCRGLLPRGIQHHPASSSAKVKRTPSSVVVARWSSIGTSCRILALPPSKRFKRRGTLGILSGGPGAERKVQLLQLSGCGKIMEDRLSLLPI